MNVVILGSNGSLGSELSRVFPSALALSRSELDMNDSKKVEEVLQSLKPMPDVIMNAAAYTNVDGSERESQAAFDINYLAVLKLVKICDSIGSRLMHFSTDYVFDGHNQSGYLESDKRNPLSVYGQTKASGERAVEDSSGNHIIVRTSWLYGRKKSFPSKIISKAKNEGLVKVVDDQFGSPTYAADLAEKIHLLLEAPKGIYHLTNTGTLCTWFDFAEEILKLAKIDCTLMPVSTEELNLPAKRPKYSILLNSKSHITGLPMRDWKSALLDYMRAQESVRT